MKKYFILCMCACLMMICVACESKNSGNGEIVKDTEKEAVTISNESKKLVVYFSATGNTKIIAEYIAELTGADIFEIVPKQPYSDADLNYNDDNCRANIEQADKNFRPEIDGTIADFSKYDVIYIGHPIWWGEEPRIIDTFMENYSFSVKTVVNFCTSGGSGITLATNNLKSMALDANWLEGKRFESNASKEDVKKWLDSYQ